MKKICSILVVLFAGIFLFAGCGKEAGLTDNPDTNTTVTSNGGSIVKKGDYIYFIRGQRKSGDLTKPKTDNVLGKTTIGAVYRAKIVNGEVQTEAEMVVPKVVGFENGGFYIFGDYIYYATPNMGNDNTGKLMNNTVNFCRINVNGDTKTNKVLSEGVSIGESGQWKAYCIDGEVYFVAYTGSSLISVKAGNKKGEKTIMASDVTSAGLPDLDVYSPTNQENAPEFENKKGLEEYNQWIYFTKAQSSNSESKGNILLKVKVGSSDSQVVARSDQQEYVYTIKAQRDGYLFYTKKNGAQEGSRALLYKSEITNGFDNETKICNAEYENIYLLKEGQNIIVVTYQDTALMSNDGTTWVSLNNGEITIIGSHGKYLYYYDKTAKSIVRINAFDGTKLTLYKDGDKNSAKTDGLSVDVAGNYVVFYEVNDSKTKTVFVDCSANATKIVEMSY